jgi:transposase
MNVLREIRATRSKGCHEHRRWLFLPQYSPELQPAEHLWPLTNAVLVDLHFTSIEELEEAQLARRAALLQRPAVIRSAT